VKHCFFLSTKIFYRIYDWKYSKSTVFCRPWRRRPVFKRFPPLIEEVVGDRGAIKGEEKKERKKRREKKKKKRKE